MGGNDSGRVDYDAELRQLNSALRRASEIGLEDKVLDIGCGTGQTTRDAARLARDGSVFGIDVSKAMVEHVHALAEAEGPAQRVVRGSRRTGVPVRVRTIRSGHQQIRHDVL